MVKKIFSVAWCSARFWTIYFSIGHATFVFQTVVKDTDYIDFSFLKEDKCILCWKCRKRNFTAETWGCIDLRDIFYRFCQQIRIMYWPSCKVIEIFMENYLHWLNNTPTFNIFRFLLPLKIYFLWRNGKSEKPSLDIVAIRSISVQTWHHSL